MPAAHLRGNHRSCYRLNLVVTGWIGYDPRWKKETLTTGEHPSEQLREGQDTSTNAVTEKGTVRIEYPLALQELLGGFRDDIERYSAEVGLLIIQEVIEAEIASRLGCRGQRSNYRHGSQAGYVVFGGRKVSISRPRMRSVEGRECQLHSYQAFQRNGRMQKAVARQLVRNCSERN